MPDLEQRLRELGPELAFPPTPSLAQTLELSLEPARRRPRRRALRAFAIACILLVLAVGTAFAVPASRHAILDWLGLSGVTVERVVSLPTVPETADLALGDPVSLEQAQRAVDFDVVVPQALGDPDETYVDQTTPGGRVTFVYRDESGAIAALVTQFQGDVHPDLVGKLVAGGTQVETVTVTGGAPGIFLSGGPHVVFYRDPGGEIRDETLRLAGNTLLWERGELLLRLESALRLEDALRVARSAQPLASR
jgi:hypothetical protein